MKTAETVPSFESVWAAFQETDRLQKENAQQMRESHTKFEKEMQESRKEFDRRMKKMEQTMGSWGNNYGDFAE
jgi:uncharacterized protein YaaN involved in tellurite resistance